MAFLDNLINMQYNQSDEGPIPNAYAAHFPTYEVQTPQWPVSPVYQLAQRYRTNDLVYGCINTRMISVSEAPLRVEVDTDGTKEFDDKHPLRKLLKNPNMSMTGLEFVSTLEAYIQIAGFAYFEKERSRAGDVIGLWPMVPHYCSVLRGYGMPIRAVRYQPYGLPPMDIPINNLITLQNFDPIWNNIRPLSPTAVALKVSNVDANMTEFLDAFFQSGTVVNGILTTDSSLNDAEASRERARWISMHGGVGNWGAPAILGKGLKYQTTSMNFREMMFDTIDERSESHICRAYNVPPVVVITLLGLRYGTYSNFEQQLKSFVMNTVSPEWRMIEAKLNAQLLPDFDESDNVEIKFDRSAVASLQDEWMAKWKAVGDATKDNRITRDEGREQMGLDPIDDEPVFIGQVRDAAGAMQAGVYGEQLKDEAQARADAAAEAQTSADQNVTSKDDAAVAQERKQFRQYAGKRIKEGHPEDIAKFRFNYIGPFEKAALLQEAMPYAPAFDPAQMNKLIDELHATRDKLEGIENVKTI